jgi:hypothetical protein
VKNQLFNCRKHDCQKYTIILPIPEIEEIHLAVTVRNKTTISNLYIRGKHA